MSDTIRGKSGVATRPSPDKEAPVPLTKRGKGKMPAQKGRKNDRAASKPDDVSRPAPPSPAAEARKEGSEPLPDSAELSKQIAEIAAKSQQLVAEFLTRQG